MPKILDNTELKLGDELKTALANATSLDACVGYFNLPGWNQLSSLINQMPDGEPSRVLVGMSVSPDDQLKDALRQSFLDGTGETRMDNKRAIRFRDRVIDNFRQQLQAGLPTNQDENTLRTLVQQLREERVQIKLFTKYPLHAKLYLIHRHELLYPRVGYVGSSNLTLAGLSGNGELNIDVPDTDATTKLFDWFEERWDDPFCIDIGADIIKVIENSWAREALVPPYHVYLKMAYHLSQDAREGLSEFWIPAIFGERLYDFQEAAVKIAAHHLEHRGGVLIGDVVGLGKTMMATALARLRQEKHGDEALIICPPSLTEMWEWYREEYHLGGKVIPISMVQKELPGLRRYNIVLIDESHTLRNTETKAYRAIREYIERNESRCILLSATPYNKQYTDLAAQIRLFEAPDRDLGIRPEAAIRAAGGELEFASKHQVNLRTLAAFEKSEEPDDWRDLMRRYLVRRTRTFIQKHYTKTDDRDRRYLEGHDGKRSYFPDRIPRTVKFEMAPNGTPSAYAELASAEVVDCINRLELARYGLGEFIEPSATEDVTPDEQQTIENLSQAGVRLKGFSRTNMLKRLESSGHSFLLTIRRHLLRNEVFLYALENGLPVPASVKGGADIQPDILDSDTELDPQQLELHGNGGENGRVDVDIYARSARAHYEEISTRHRTRHNWLPADYFTPELTRSLRHDTALLREILAQGRSWNPASDPKLIALRNLLTQQHRHEKVLIFTQYADTAEYLTNQLQDDVPKLAGVTGGAANPTAYAQRFSPVSNNYKIPDGQELRVLISTDVLSEGQNLQDAHIVVNYDLPWAIIKLIQRVGRVDRIGQQAEEIYCYSFLPAQGIEELIRLRQRVQHRLQENAEVVGADEVFFEGDKQDEDALVNLYNEKSGILDDDGADEEVDLASYALQIWKDATDDNPELRRKAEGLDNVVYANRHHVPTDASPVGVMVYVRTPDDADALARVDENGDLVSQSPLTILRAAACEPDTTPARRASNHHLLVKIASQKGISSAGTVGSGLGTRNSVRYRIYARAKAYDQAFRERLFAENNIMPDDIRRNPPAAMEAVLSNPLLDFAKNTLGRLMKTGATDEQLMRELVDLHLDEKLVINSDDGRERTTRIICSLGLVES